MRKYLNFIPALLVSVIATDAKAQDAAAEQVYSKATQRLLKQLDSIGINNKEVVDLVATVKEHTEKNSLDFYQQDVPTGHIKFRYQYRVDPMPGTGFKQQHTQLVYTPDFDNHTEVIASKGGVTINFKLKFP